MSALNLSRDSQGSLSQRWMIDGGVPAMIADELMGRARRLVLVAREAFGKYRLAPGRLLLHPPACPAARK